MVVDLMADFNRKVWEQHHGWGRGFEYLTINPDSASVADVEEREHEVWYHNCEIQRSKRTPHNATRGCTSQVKVLQSDQGVILRSRRIDQVVREVALDERNTSLRIAKSALVRFLRRIPVKSYWQKLVQYVDQKAGGMGESREKYHLSGY